MGVEFNRNHPISLHYKILEGDFMKWDPRGERQTDYSP